MKVLQVSLFHPELVRGGAQQVCYELFEGLKERSDVEVTLLASVDESYPALFKSGARITGFDGRPSEYLFLSRTYDHWWHRTGNPLLVESFAEFLRVIRPDVVHFHHFLTLGVDLLPLTRRILPDSRIIFTLHEFLSICLANGHMRRPVDGSLCTGSSPVRCHQCFPEHHPESFFLRERWIKKNFDAVDAFTTPSRFMMERYRRWGIPAQKLHHVTNGQRNYGGGALSAAVVESPPKKRNRFGFFGQMVDAKGVHVLLQAVELLRAAGFDDFQVELNGDNLRYASEARRKEIEAFLSAEAERPMGKRNVAHNGSYHVGQLPTLMSRIDWCVVPSIWEETFCLVVSEAWMCGRPVIASNCGAMAERVRHEEDGLLFDVGNPMALAAAMRRACEQTELWPRLVGQLPSPPSRDEMVSGFINLYSAHENSLGKSKIA